VCVWGEKRGCVVDKGIEEVVLGSSLMTRNWGGMVEILKQQTNNNNNNS
jgi:hypothetical protein